MRPSPKLPARPRKSPGLQAEVLEDRSVPSAVLLKDINTRTGDALVAGDSRISAIVFHHRTFFVGDDGIHGRELWSTDGTAAGTLLREAHSLPRPR